MTEQKARLEGLDFTGHYERFIEPIKEKAKEIRKKGYKARTVISDGGYSIYAEKKYFTDKQIKSYKNTISGFSDQLRNFKEKQKKEMADLLADQQRIIDSL